jgi:diguanylate cyclase (GGDEF)-like protein
MKHLILAIAVTLGCTTAVWAATPATLTTLRAIHNLTNAEASKELPVDFEGTVTFSRLSEHTLFVQDGGTAIYVHAQAYLRLLPGDRIRVQGKTQASFHPDVASDRLTLLHHGVLPKPAPVTYNELVRGQRDCILVTVRAVVHSADMEYRSDVRNPSLPKHSTIHAQILVDNSPVDVFIDSEDASALPTLLDAEVELTGVAGMRFDGKMQPTEVQLSVSSLADVKLLKPAAVTPLSLPVTTMDQILSSYRVQDFTKRVHVQGIITYYQPGQAVVLQNGSKSLWIALRTSRADLHLYDQADATGFPAVQGGFLVLTDGEVHNSNAPSGVNPQPEAWQKLASSARIFDLVSIEGKVVTEVREGLQDEYVISSDGNLFTAILDQDESRPLPMKQIPIGSTIRVTGICVLGNSNPFHGHMSFNILLRTANDILVVARPSLLNIQNLVLLVGLLLTVVGMVGVRGWALERQMRRQTAVMSARTEAEAELERRRSRILEQINGNEPLAAILEQIAGLVSFNLGITLCWCEVADGARLGNYPKDMDKLRVVQEEIAARTGPALGRLLAAFDAKTPPRPSEKESLVIGTRLATLAIETRRRDADLRHRSEFDLLTDVHNRFSLERRLKRQIDLARHSAGIFGLIYIDLDRFKQINDLYGHHTGDLYLQAVAARLKQQLRPGDLLARLGGDEFAALLPTVRNRAAVEEVVRRLKHCFNDPFVLEEHTVQGTASFGIALYPEDSASADSLLNAADAAMYIVKKNHRVCGRA